MTSVRIRRLDDGYLVIDDRGATTWEGAAVTLADAEALADNRLHPRGPSAPPRMVRPNITTGGYDEPTPGLAAGEPFDAPEHPLAAAQYARAADETERCVGSLCGHD
jgi:hypothetical protein